MTDPTNQEAPKADQTKKGSRKRAAPAPAQISIQRTLKVASRPLLGFLKAVFPGEKDFRMVAALNYSRKVIGNKQVNANTQLLQQLVELHIEETKKTLAILRTLEARAVEAGQMSSFSCKTVSVSLSIGSRFSMTLIDLVGLLDQALVLAEALTFCGALPDEQRVKQINKLMERANTIRVAIQQVLKTTEAATKAARDAKAAEASKQEAKADAPNEQATA